MLPLSDERTTLAEVLRDRGYVTGGFAANFANLDRGFGMAQGFGHYEDHPGLLFRPVPHVVRFVQRFRPAFCKKPFRSAEEINTAALNWLDRAPTVREGIQQEDKDSNPVRRFWRPLALPGASPYSAVKSQETGVRSQEPNS